MGNKAYEMKFIDIHTHRIPDHDDSLSIVNRIIGRDELLPNEALQSCGIHPWFIEGDGMQQLERLRAALCSSSVVALGEAGLDKAVDTSIILQQTIFEEEVRLSEKTKKPLVIHCVKAFDELLAIRNRLNPSMPWIIHGFRGKETQAVQLLKKGLYLSFGEYFHPESLQAAWPDHLFVETDESKLPISILYQRLSDSLNVGVEPFAAQIENNFRRIFLQI
jgi:TatD DNase family protein